MTPISKPEQWVRDQNRPPALAVRNLSVTYGDTIAMAGADIDVPAGSLMAVVGPSGCGKSSLLAAISGLSGQIPGARVRGEILLNGQALTTQDRGCQAGIGMVFQQPNPFPLSIFENIAFPLREHGLRRVEALRMRVHDALRQVGLWQEVCDRLDQSALQLSGGQQQRLCFARALALQPAVLLLDEPCSALDPVATEHIEQLIHTLKGRYTLLMVTHNLAQARRLGDGVTVCWLDQACGCVVETGTRSIFEAPAHPVSQRYFSGAVG